MSKCLFVLLIATALTGCENTELRNLVNKMLPPISTEERTIQAIDLSRSELGKIANPSFALLVTSADISSLVTPALGSKGKEIQDPKVRLEKQSIAIEATFEGTFSSENLEAKGKLAGSVAVALGHGKLVLFPAFESLQLERVKSPRSSLDITSVANKLAEALVAFKDNVNGQIKPIELAFDTDQILRWDPAASLQKSPRIIQVTGNTVDGRLILSSAALLIDEQGIHGLGAANVIRIPTKEERPALIARLEAGENVSATVLDVLCSEQPDTQNQSRFAAACDSFTRAKTTNVRPAPKSMQISTQDARKPQADDISRAFTEYQKTYLAAQETSLLKDANAAKDKTFLAVSKQFLGDAVNELLGSPGLCATANISQPSQHFDQEIRLSKAPDLNCVGGARGCNINQECSQSRDCNPGWACPDCQWYDAGCHVRKVGCEVDKGRYRGQCELEKKVAHDSCEVDKALKKGDCERLKAMEIAGCQINQGWLDTWSEHKIGSLSGDISEDGQGQVCVKSIHVREDLSGIDVGLSVGGSADVRGNLKFVPAGLGNLACLAQWEAPFQTRASLLTTDLPVGATLAFDGAGDTTALKISLTDSEVVFQTNPPPLAALVGANPGLAVICAPAIAVAGLNSTFRAALGQEQPPEISGRIKHKLENIAFRLPVGSMTLKEPKEIGGRDRTFVPVWTDQSILMVETK